MSSAKKILIHRDQVTAKFNCFRKEPRDQEQRKKTADITIKKSMDVAGFPYLS